MRQRIINALRLFVKSATKTQQINIAELYGVKCGELLEALGAEERRNAKKSLYYRKRRLNKK